MSAAPSARAEFTRSLRALIAVFQRHADADVSRILERMDIEIRHGNERVFDHVYRRYVHWWQRQRLDSAAVRLTEGELFADVEFAIKFDMPVFDAIEARARARSAR